MDTSIYEDVKETVLEALQAYEKILTLDTVLFIVDDTFNQLLSEVDKRLKMEYYGNKDTYAKYCIESIVKHLNSDGAVHTYSLNEKIFHRQINDQEKVLNILEAEFATWCNRLKKDVSSKLKEQKLPDELIKEKRIKLDAEIALAQIELDFILANHESLEIRISSFINRPSYGVIARFRTNDTSASRTVRLKNSIPNVLHLKKKEEKTYPNNKLSRFLKESVNPFGDVYYKKTESTFAL